MALLLSDLVLPAFHAAAYAVLVMFVWAQAAVRFLSAVCCTAAARVAAVAPALRPLLSAIFALPLGEHIGTRPRPPTVLGVAVAEDIADADWPAAAESLGSLLAWAHDRGFKLVLLYEPAGRLQQPTLVKQLELQLLQHRLCGSVHLQVGWTQVQGSLAEQQGAGGVDSTGSGMTAVLLAAADGQWPLVAATGAGGAAAAGKDGGGMGAGGEATAGDAATRAWHEGSRAAAIDVAIAAPARLRQRVQAAAGSLAGSEPDFVLVTGPALTLAGFPAWAVRTSEMYGVGTLAALRGRRELDAALHRFRGTKQRWGK